MNTDFRISVDFFNHHKTLKLQRKLGESGIISLLKLWAYASKVRSNGILTGMSKDDIEAVAGWMGEDGKFVDVLTEISFLSLSGNIFSLHDWTDHNPWAASSEQRGNKSRFSRLASINPELFNDLKSKGIDSISKHEYEALTNGQRIVNEALTENNESLTIVQPQAPSPSPSPIPDPEESKKPPLPLSGGELVVEKIQVSKPEKKKRENTGSSAKELKAAIEAYTQYEPLREALENYRLMRERIGKPMTGKALELVFNKLQKLALKDHQGQIEILEQSIMNSWQGIFPLREAARQGPGPGDSLLARQMKINEEVLARREERRKQGIGGFFHE